MDEHMETWHCQECGGTHYYWHFRAPDGTSLIAQLPSAPVMEGMAAAKAKALADHTESKGAYQ